MTLHSICPAIWPAFRPAVGLATVAGLAMALAAASATGAAAQDRVKWKMQSAFSGTLPHLGTSGVRFAKNMERVSGVPGVEADLPDPVSPT